jgi:hypothetical protein
MDKNKIYNLLAKNYSCGPFDGGCLIIASALQKKHGGKVVVLYSKKIAEHAAVLLNNGMLIDFDGKKEAKKFIKNFEEIELRKIESYREIKDNDLIEAYRDEKLSNEIVKYL